MWLSRQLSIAAKPRGFHLITDEVSNALPEIRQLKVGVLHVFIQHTSASLTINENADPSVRHDLEQHFNRSVPENAPYYQHMDEGSDDMPAHIKASTLGASQSIPIANGQLQLGLWQGLYLCEHRNYATNRTLVLTLNGE
ncbi:secondary thiamine-phosphate synthase enzyme YjbQ [Psychrobium sp. 1_MG-2023]|uniref:secondary thiamine-phosphate synthase enzyme YjbQ n=1 Tax=Psychrobium sp. 1_MG-2023 TaxID=3062624 RepID=UPI000C34BF62|nr:secondary thiamine-phosphate synthase enzyme YjbQ [Psychrobium sp. 1_MG-2023]MDP2560711.1 secondary thiamine-phosphate synthase enzyme YjbQ [Psychrobium sp. 1_MG-2023]PKF56605.1 hypothetical protein CW748_08970 [Alteromonadales bacterium alter-6D02]